MWFHTFGSFSEISSLALGVIASKAWQIYQFIFSATSSQKSWRRKINLPVLDLGFHHISPPYCVFLAFSVSVGCFSTLFAVELRDDKWKIVKEKLEDDKSCRHERLWMRPWESENSNMIRYFGITLVLYTVFIS